jgi:hypothetical protein
MALPPRSPPIVFGCAGENLGLDMEPRTNYCHAFMQYGYNDFWSGTDYALSDDIAKRYWNNFYIPVLQNLEFILPLLKANTGMVTTYAAARIWRVFIYQKLTDYYGDIPYSQAGKALRAAFLHRLTISSKSSMPISSANYGHPLRC